MSKEVMIHARQIINAAAKECSICGEIALYSGYAEPGYTDPESGVIATGNWNTITKWNKKTRKFDVIDTTPAEVAHELEKLGVETQWCDEWYSCYACNKLVRCSSNCYGWQPAYSRSEGETILCLKCVNPKEHLESCVKRGKGNEIASIKPADHGYVLIEGQLENGMYGGQKANPDIISKSMNEAGVRGVLINLDDAGQFDLTFSVWVLKKLGKKNIAKAHEVMRMPSKINQKKDPAEILKRSLQTAPVVQVPQVGGIQHTKVNLNDGTVTIRIVSPQEFLEGIKDE